MKLILTQEVSNLGAPGDVVEVKDGYGRNYLIPQGVAIAWTQGGEKQIDVLRRARQARQVRDLDHAREIKTQLESLAVRLTARVGRNNRLFGSVTPADVVQAVRAAGGPNLDRRRVDLPQQIKTVGAHSITVKIHPEVSATIRVNVVPVAS